MSLSSTLTIISAILSQPILWIENPKSELGDFWFYTLGLSIVVFFIAGMISWIMESIRK